MSAKEGASEIAARLWPPPDPVNHCRREAVAELAEADRAIRQSVSLRARANEVVFEDLAALWIHKTRVEVLLALLRGTLIDAARHVRNTLDRLEAARSENELRFYDECIRAREERRCG